jgi:hypothetical protein
MNIRIHKNNNGNIAELIHEGIRIDSTDDMLDVIAESGLLDSQKMIIWEYQLNPDFFSLSTGIAGDMLQKISNYRMRLAIVGDFSKYPGKSLRDFIRECNRGKMVCFTGSLEEAIDKLK